MTRREYQDTLARQSVALSQARDLSETHDRTVWVYAVCRPSGQIDQWIRFTEIAETEIDGQDVRPIASFRGGYPIFAILPL